MRTIKTKGDPKTMRFEQDVKEYIESFEGKDFTDKFHNLVRWFIKTEESKKTKIKELDKLIRDKEKRLNELSDMLYKVCWLEDKFKSLDRSIEDARDSLKRIITPNNK